MIKYILKSVIQSVVTLLIVLFIVFILLRSMPIEGYFSNYERMTATQIRIGLTNLGLDKPIHEQFCLYLWNVLHLNFGVSQRYRVNADIGEIVRDKLSVSLQLGFFAALFGVSLGIFMGFYMARSSRKRQSVPIGDRLGIALISFVDAVPSSVCILFIQIFGTEIINMITPLPTLFRYNNPLTWVLPVFSLSFTIMIWFAIWLRRYMIDESTESYVKFAYVKGLPEGKISGHILRNAIVPLSQGIPISILSILVGSIYIESRYSIPGLGCLLVDAIKCRDNMLVQALVLLYSAINIIGIQLGDVTMLLLDPRIRYDSTKDRR